MTKFARLSSGLCEPGACHRNNQKSKGVDNGREIGHNIAVNIL